MSIKHVALYVRVSTEEQRKHGLSVDSQLDALKKYCAEHRYTIVGIYNDAGYSAAKSYTTRPALLRLMDDCSKGIFDLILFTRLDRWFRSVPDYYQVQSVLDANHIAWRAIWEDYETETSSGIFKVNIMLSIAQAEAQRTSEKIRSVLQYKREAGAYVGQPPMGYLRINKKDLVIDDTLAPAIHALFDTYLVSNSITQATLSAHEHGMMISMQQAYRMLKKEAYAGLASGYYECPAYITWEDHERILAMMKKNTRTTTSKRTYYFSGILFCSHCGMRLGASSAHKKLATGEDRYIKHYRCAGNRQLRRDCPGCYINEKKLERYLLDHLDSELEAYNLKIITRSKEYNPSDIQKQITSLKAKLQRIGVRYEDGDITYDEYKDKRLDINQQLDALQFRLAEQPTPIYLSSDWKAVYMSLDDKHKQRFWRSILDRITVPTDRSNKLELSFR